jgi:hypothetical protein
MNQDLSISAIIKNGSALGAKNFLSIIGAIILFVLTFWIPYLNVGTFIAITSLPLKMSEGKVFSPTEIFKEKYRKNMGEFLLFMALLMIIIYMGMIFLIIPAIVMGITFGYGKYFLLDKEVSPTEALKMSNKATYGHKWNIFLSKFVLIIGLYLVMFICMLISPTFGMIIAFIASLMLFPIMLGMDAYIYKEISTNSQESID